MRHPQLDGDEYGGDNYGIEFQQLGSADADAFRQIRRHARQARNTIGNPDQESYDNIQRRRRQQRPENRRRRILGRQIFQ